MLRHSVAWILKQVGGFSVLSSGRFHSVTGRCLYVNVLGWKKDLWVHFGFEA